MTVAGRVTGPFRMRGRGLGDKSATRIVRVSPGSQAHALGRVISLSEICTQEGMEEAYIMEI